MPEVISKHPDVVLKVLNAAGAKCGMGSAQQILKKCPVEKFCSLPSGEICVYGINDIPQMTQMTKADLEKVVVSLPTIDSWENTVFIITVFLIGLVVGVFLKK